MMARQLVWLLILTAILGVAACATRQPTVLNLVDGPEKAASEIAILRVVTAGLGEVDGRRILPPPDRERYFYRDFRLSPGQHVLGLYREFMVSVFLEPTGSVKASRDLTVNLEAGHTYELRAGRTTGHGYKIFFWIEDAATGKVVAGERGG